MHYRDLGDTGMRVSEISFGAWAIGGAWGEVDDEESYAALERAVELGVNFIDTADVYGDGHSERLVGQLLEDTDQELFVATKAGRRLDPHTAEGYSYDNLRPFVERSLTNLGVERLDLLQMHCPPTETYHGRQMYSALERFKDEGLIKNAGVSVERVEEARSAVEHPVIGTVQMIFNVLRQKPAEEFFPLAEERGVGVIARVPLASGLLSGKMTADREFSADDHRNFNREGQAFDVGETFSGLNFETGLAAAEELKGLVPGGETLAGFALRWILMHRAVSCAIPGAKRPSHAEGNIAASELPVLSEETMDEVREVYDRYAREVVRDRW